MPTDIHIGRQASRHTGWQGKQTYTDIGTHSSRKSYRQAVVQAGRYIVRLAVM